MTDNRPDWQQTADMLMLGIAYVDTVVRGDQEARNAFAVAYTPQEIELGLYGAFWHYLNVEANREGITIQQKVAAVREDYMAFCERMRARTV